MQHINKQIAKPIDTVKLRDGRVSLLVQSTVLDREWCNKHGYPYEWVIPKELYTATDKKRVMTRLGLTEKGYNHWLAQLK